MTAPTVPPVDAPDFAAFARPGVRALAPYQPGKPVEDLERELGITGAVKVASNENPLGPSPRAIEGARRALATAHLYPDAGQTALRRALAAHLEVEVEEVVVTNGADDLLHHIVSAFCRPGVDQVVTPRHGFISYRLAAQLRDVQLVETPLTATLRVDVDALIAALGPTTRVVFLGHPNNPTGAALTRPELARVLAAAPAGTIVVLDEAYHEFARAFAADYPSGLEHHRRATHPALIVARTFSKAYGLAGLRVGYAVAPAGVVELLDRVRRPFNVNAIGQAAAIEALADQAHVERTVEVTRAGMASLVGALGALGLTTYPSIANFVLVDLGRPAAPVYYDLLRRGVIVRPMVAWGLPSCLRVSIGTADECGRVAAAFGEALA
jgi:histidinol-phosphate aminotransferase